MCLFTKNQFFPESFGGNEKEKTFLWISTIGLKGLSNWLFCDLKADLFLRNLHTYTVLLPKIRGWKKRAFLKNYTKKN